MNGRELYQELEEHMSIISKILYTVAFFQILHSGFASYEFHQYVRAHDLPHVENPLPTDIKFECYMGVCLFILATFLTIEKEKYYPVDSTEKKVISTGQYLKEIKLNKATSLDNLIGFNPTANVTNTPCLVDIHQKRKEFKEWLEENNDDAENTKEE